MRRLLLPALAVTALWLSAGGLTTAARAELITGTGLDDSHVKRFPQPLSALSAPDLSFPAFPGFTGGVRVASGDLDGDGVPDIIVGAAPGGSGGHVKVFDGATGELSQSFFSFPSFVGGVYVAAGDVNASGTLDIIVAADGPNGHIKVFDGVSNESTLEFFSFPGFTGEVRIAAADLDGNGAAEIIAGVGPGGTGGHIKIFDGATGVLQSSFFAFDGFTGGVHVAAGDVNGDGVPDIVVGADTADHGHIKVFDGQSGLLMLSFFAFLGAPGGVRVAAGDLNGDGIAEIIAGAGAGTPGGHVKVFDGTGTQQSSFFAYDPSFTGGVFVAAPVPFVPTAIPEPATALLLALAAAGAILRRRR